MCASLFSSRSGCFISENTEKLGFAIFMGSRGVAENYTILFPLSPFFLPLRVRCLFCLPSLTLSLVVFLPPHLIVSISMLIASNNLATVFFISFEMAIYMISHSILPLVLRVLSLFKYIYPSFLCIALLTHCPASSIGSIDTAAHTTRGICTMARVSTLLLRPLPFPRPHRLPLPLPLMYTRLRHTCVWQYLAGMFRTNIYVPFHSIPFPARCDCQCKTHTRILCALLFCNCTTHHTLSFG
jgi:hypothetical protein